MSTFRITFKQHQNSPHQTDLVEANDVSVARQKLIESYGGLFSIRSVSMQCEATTKTGNPCQRFSGDRLCASHRNWQTLSDMTGTKVRTGMFDNSDISE
jgi:hypothetical protein